jgi:hypothetical protein
MTSTEAKDWAIPEIRGAVGSDKIRFIGKYSAPDYEALIEDEADIAIESTMIYHKPQVKEAIEELGIPVLVERSSYENDPLARLEWIKLYGLLFGREDEAEAFFDDAVAKVSSVDTASVKETPSVAFFSVNSAGAVVVRKPGDYITKMIETAGGRYALDGITPEEDNALSTMNMQMEAFYEARIEPFLVALSLELTRKVFSKKAQGHDNHIVYEANRLQFATMSTKVTVFKEVVLYGGMTINEWRQGCNMAPLPDGDVPIRRLDAAAVNEEPKEDSNEEDPEQEGENENE